MSWIYLDRSPSPDFRRQEELGTMIVDAASIADAVALWCSDDHVVNVSSLLSVLSDEQRRDVLDQPIVGKVLHSPLTTDISICDALLL